MSRIDIAELNDFLHGLRSSNAEAKTMMKKIKEAAMDYAQDNSLKGEAVSTSKRYFSSTYTSICQSIIEALDESEERLSQYIREFGSQVDSSPSARIDAEILQEAMAKVSQLQRKEEDLHRQLTAPNTKPDMQQVYVVKSRSVHTQLLKAIEKENILERYLAFEQSHGQFFSALDELIRATGRAVQELLQQVTFNEKTGTYSVPTSANNSLLLMKLYLKVNAMIQDIFLRYVPREFFLAYSIDEAFLDVTGSHRLFGSTQEIAEKIQADILLELRLFVTVGIGDNLLLSKLALDNAAKHQKDGIATWRYENVPDTIWKIRSLEDMWGIGHRTAENLKRLGIFSVYALSQAPPPLLKSRLGVIGEQLYYHSHGIDYIVK
ncbi:TPA: T7SS effector LXG polymorphic toxin [Listeria monocytogenes]|uniref:T7SS effector LXG polymorphic toxin n=1 Tax=Listeria seeligeri TaxID=1640 RepID=UPI0021AB63F7|nr:T7SS effector LXG polymorphic toxin [Listeria seeligeri]